MGMEHPKDGRRGFPPFSANLMQPLCEKHVFPLLPFFPSKKVMPLDTVVRDDDGDIYVFAKILNMKNGDITALQFNNRMFCRKSIYQITGVNKPVKKSFLQKWVEKLSVGSEFTLDEFYKKYPKHRYNKNMQGNISRIIRERLVIQLGKDKFRRVDNGIDKKN